MTPHRLYYAVLIAMGIAWGGVFSLSKIAVSTGHQPFGLLLWQAVIAALMSGAILAYRRKLNCLSPRFFMLFFGVGVLGTVFPNYFSFRAVQELPAGIMVVIIALVPLFALPIALVLRFELFSWKRFSGILFGAIAVGLLVGPDASLPDASKVGFVFLAILVPLAYGAEGNFLVWIGDKGLDPVQILFGANLVGIALAVPLVISSGHYVSPFRIWGAAEWAIVANSIVNWFAYIGYVWLIKRAGPVFAAQVAYLVTGFGVIWAMMILGESYSIYIWAALGLMMIGMFLVQPRDNEPILGDDVADQI